MARARLAGTQAVSVEPPLYQPHFTYDESGVLHSVWFLDAVTFRNQYAAALSKKVGGVALYRLGQEDAAIWTVIAKSDGVPHALEPLTPADTVANIGQGDVLTAINQREPGRRRIIAPATAPPTTGPVAEAGLCGAAAVWGCTSRASAVLWPASPVAAAAVSAIGRSAP